MLAARNATKITATTLDHGARRDRQLDALLGLVFGLHRPGGYPPMAAMEP